MEEKESTSKEGTSKIPVFDKNIISSVHINFLFGAGVNGSALSQLKDFHETLNKIQELGGDISRGLESGIDTISDEDKRDKIKDTFVREFELFYEKAIKGTDWDQNASLQNLKKLLIKIYAVVHESQNRNPSMKQINIYTLNYDDIVERMLKRLGYFYNSISASNTETKAPLLNVIGFDYNTRNYIPSFMVSKLHGDMDKPIIPGKAKYQEMLNEDYFEVAFSMKSQLCKPNSILIVIGYSGGDNHINKIVKDCMNAGLTVYWYKYSEKDSIPDDLRTNVFIREQADYNNPQDTTKNCFEDLETAWAEKLVE